MSNVRVRYAPRRISDAVALLLVAITTACGGGDSTGPDRPPVTSVTVEPASASVQDGGTVQLTATPRDVDGAPLAGRAVAWATGEAAIATVSNTGLVSGVAAGGPVTITATTDGVSGTAAITVAPAASLLLCGDLAAGSTSAAGEVDLFNFNGQSGAMVSLTIVETADYGPFTSARATLLSPTGTSLRVFDSNSQQDLTLPATGTYVIRVNASNLVATGSYHLGLECVLPLGPVDATMSNGSLVSGSITAAGEVDHITFTGQSGALVSLVIVETTDFGPFTSARGTLFSPTRVALRTFDSNSQQEITLAEDGTYLVRVNASNLAATGSYSLGLEGILPPTPPDATLTCAALLSGAISASGEVDLFTFGGQAGDQITLTIVETTDFGPFTSARATLFSPSGAALKVFDSNSQFSTTLPAAGTYLVRVNASNLVSTGTYNLGMTCP